MDRVIAARRFGQLTHLEALADGKRESRLPEQPTAELARRRGRENFIRISNDHASDKLDNAIAIGVEISRLDVSS